MRMRAENLTGRMRLNQAGDVQSCSCADVVANAVMRGWRFTVVMERRSRGACSLMRDNSSSSEMLRSLRTGAFMALTRQFAIHVLSTPSQ